jgi:S-layer family protein
MKTLAPLLIALAGLAVTASAQPADGEFGVNTYTTFDQRLARVAMEADGDFVVVWSNKNLYGAYTAIYGRRFDVTTAPRGIEFRVDQGVESQALAAVAISGTGAFVVVWHDTRDIRLENIHARMYDAAGGAIGSEFTVNDYLTGRQQAPDVSRAPDGRFVVAWTSDRGDGSNQAIIARRYDSLGNPMGGEFVVNTYTTGAQILGRVAMDASGGFVIVWEDYLTNRDGSGSSIFGQRFDAAGNRIGGEFQVNSYTTGHQQFPSVAMAPSGRFVVAWRGSDGSLTGVFARVFDAAGNPVAGDFVVNTYTTGYQFGAFSQVAMDALGNFVVVWASQQEGIGDVFAQRFNAVGARQGAEFRVNSYTSDLQVQPAVASLPAGKFVVVWDSHSQDGSGVGVFGKRFGGLAPSGLAVDATAGPSSNANGVFDPGEIVIVAPSWRNLSGSTQTISGTAQSFTGPGMPTNPAYTIVDGTAIYGPVADGAAASCVSAGNCYVLGTSVPASRPATHWDAFMQEDVASGVDPQTKSWVLHMGGTFSDVPPTSSFYRYVETLVHNGVSAGCKTPRGVGSYCPQQAVTREQVAPFLLLSKDGPGYVPPPCTMPPYTDVPISSPFCPWIQELQWRSILFGCTTTEYCPGAPVARAEMAALILETLDPQFNPPPCTPPGVYPDVPADAPYCPWIEELARRGVLSDCGGGNFCPKADITRETGAYFLTAGFGLTLYGP